MAITITQEPNLDDVANRRLMFACTSNNTGNTGFKFRIVVTTVQGTNSFWYSPNPNNAAIIDIAQLIKLTNEEQNGGTSIHKRLAPYLEPSGAGVIYTYTVSVQEAWIVDGTLQLQGSATTRTYDMVWNGVLQVSDSQTFSIAGRFRLTKADDRWASDRKWNTHYWLYGNLYGLGMSVNRVFIPVRSDDWGVMTLPWVRSKITDRITVGIYDEDGVMQSADIDVSAITAGKLYHYPVYPKNLNANTIGLPKPSDNPGWAYISVRAFLNTSARSVEYILYKVDNYLPVECLYNNVRIAWKGFGGGWEYFNFTKRNEKSYTIDRKQYRKIVGAYSNQFIMYGMERGLTETDIVAEQILTANSDWVSENEFEFLTGLFVSRQVMIVNDDGTHTPVVVQDNGFTERKARDGKQYNQQIQLKFSNNLWV